MAHRLSEKIGSNFLLIALAAVLVLGGVMAACGKTQTTTAPAATTTRATTSAAATTTTSAPAATTTTAPRPTTTAPTSSGPSAADFYKNNVVSLIVPYVPGGGTDIMGRLFATYWTEVTGGRMVVVNKDGAGGLLGANYVYAAKPDGLTMGVTIPGTGLFAPALAQDPAVKFDLKKMTWIEFTNPDFYALGIGPKLPYNSMDDLSKGKGFKFGSTGKYTSATEGCVLLIDFFGLNDAKIVLGYGGYPDILLAVQKGEVDGYLPGSATALDALGNGQIKRPLVIVDVQKSANFPDVPTIMDLLKLSPEQESMLRTFSALGLGQLFWLPPGVPQDRIDFVRNAFDKIAAMDGFLKLAALRWKYQPPTSGKDYAALMEKTLAVATPERYNELKALTDKYVR